MKQILGIGNSDFKKIIDTNTFYVDKTYFIEEWLSNTDEVTLITRPRRFGKTLTMSMLEYFLSDKCKEQAYLFENLYIYNCDGNQRYRDMQGSATVINISFSGIKFSSYKETFNALKELVSEIYIEYLFLLDTDILKEIEKKKFEKIVEEKESETEFVNALRKLSVYLERYTGKKVYIFLDEYDTPLQTAYVSGYWENIVELFSMLFSNTFKENKSLNRAILTGITRVAKESLFSGLNNLRVISTTNKSYASCFGFTEKETFDSLDMYGLTEEKEGVKRYYDGFIMGENVEIYNPWSVGNFLIEKKYEAYWINTSSNSLIGVSVKQANLKIKNQMLQLLKDNTIEAKINEDIVFRQLDNDPDALWSLMLASGYLKVCNVSKEKYTLAITNQETKSGLENLIKDWFKQEEVNYSDFVKAMLKGDELEMEECLNELSIAMFSSFDVGTRPSKLDPERFYHGFVLGLLVDLKEIYVVDSNRESGRGRYDIMLKPRNIKKDIGVIIEFKVFSPRREKDIEESVENALKQIEEKQYEQKLKDEGVQTIYKYGIAFCGKECRIGMK